jgi:hypothetical protein
VLISSNIALGSSSEGGADSLSLYICSKIAGSGDPPTWVGGGLVGIKVPQNTVVPIGLTAAIHGLSAGTLQIGMCGITYSANWNLKGDAFTSVLIFTEQ